MIRKIKLMSLTASTVVIASAVLASSAEQMSMPMGDSIKTAKAVTTTAPIDTAKLIPQTSCPIYGEAINKKLFVDYKGKRIYVCCAACIAEVKKDPEKSILRLKSLGQSVETLASVKTSKTVQKTPAASSDTFMKGMDMSKDPSMKGMDHSKM
jgi:hypothetical protein